MDPDACWENLCRLAGDVLQGEPTDDTTADELAQGIDDLRRWLEQGGFAPRAFRTGPEAPGGKEPPR